MRDLKFRLIENNKIVGYEKHMRSGSEGIKVFHSISNDDSKDWEWWNTNDITKWIRHEYKEQYIDFKDKTGKEIFENDTCESYNQLNIIKYIEGSYRLIGQHSDKYKRNYDLISEYLIDSTLRTKNSKFDGITIVLEIIGNIHET